MLTICFVQTVTSTQILTCLVLFSQNKIESLYGVFPKKLTKSLWANSFSLVVSTVQKNF